MAIDFDRLVRFVAVGIANTAFGYATYLGMLWAGLPYWAAWGGSLFLSLLFGFYMSGRFVFENAKTKRIVWYYLSWFAIYLLNIAVLDPLIASGVSEELAPILMLPVNVPLSYLLQKHLVFPSGESDDPARS